MDRKWQERIIALKTQLECVATFIFEKNNMPQKIIKELGLVSPDYEKVYGDVKQ